ncbi:nucleotidyltransferase domain-containing protein [Candidatus Woesearchaeota archaeon]|nr:nucleotidyltransferase domain-containing protein [Candidatus Woesearchaeota archaeon]
MNFRNFLEKNAEARKVFGKREIEIMARQLDGIALTQSEKNRLSRDIRPKLRFIEGCAEFKDEFGMKKGSHTKETINEAVKIILQDRQMADIKMILLFGSAAENKMSYRSDIDIAVVFNRPVPRKEAGEFRLRLLGKLPSKVDLQVFDVLPMKIRREILKKNKILYKAKDFDSAGFWVQAFKQMSEFFSRIQHAK